MIVSLAIAAALGIVTILLDDLGWFGERALLTSLLVGAFSLTALVCAYVLSRRRVVAAMWTGIAASFAALVLWELLLWDNFGGETEETLACSYLSKDGHTRRARGVLHRRRELPVASPQ